MTNNLLQSPVIQFAQTISIFVTLLLWVVITAYWIISSKDRTGDHKGAEIFSFIKLIGSSLIIYLPLLTGGFIASTLFRPAVSIDLVGLMLCISGIGSMIWARQSLGGNWSGEVVLQEAHTLTKDGPYQFVRHPIYSSGLIAMLGSALIVGQIFGFVWAAFCAFGLIRKARQEEELLSSKFPMEFPLYKAETKMLIPFIW